jgi:hypothetical protein
MNTIYLVVCLVSRTLGPQVGDVEALALRLYRDDTSELRARLQAIPKSQLRKTSDSLAIDIGRNPEKAAAVPYALALANIDVSKNLKRMRSVYLAFDWARRKNSSSRAALMDVTDYLNYAYYNIWSHTRNPLAVKFLWEMELDGGLSEGQAIFAVKCFEHAPYSFLQAVKMRRGSQAMGFGDDFQDLARTNPSEFKRLMGVLTQSARKSGQVGANARIILGSMQKG